MLLKDKAEYEKFTREYIILAIEHIEEREACRFSSFVVESGTVVLKPFDYQP